MNPVLGTITPDPVAEILGTGFNRFSTPAGVEGLAKEFGDRLDILAVASRVQGQGLFRSFILNAQLHYQTIYVWEVWNEVVEQALQRYGFVRARERDRDSGETLQGWRWDARIEFRRV